MDTVVLTDHERPFSESTRVIDSLFGLAVFAPVHMEDKDVIIAGAMEFHFAFAVAAS